MDKKKSVRYVNIILKSKLCPVGKGNVMEQSKTKPLYFIREKYGFDTEQAINSEQSTINN